jgi:hypothetical protein
LEIQYDIYGAIATENGIVIQIDNSFYRFYPAERELEHIYTPQFTIHDFCVTPDHGIGYFWGNIFVESVKFNYYTFSLNRNETLFEYSKFIPDSNQPYYDYQTYLKQDSLWLFLRTKNVSRSDQGVFYSINLFDTSEILKMEYENMLSVRILDYNDFENIDVVYGLPQSNAEASSINLVSGSKVNEYRFANSWYESEYHIDENNISITHHSISQLKTTEFVNWKSVIRHFSVKTPDGYNSAFVGIQHYEESLVLLFNQKLDIAIGFSQDGCKLFKLIAQNNIESIVYMDNEKVVTLSDKNLIELFML